MFCSLTHLARAISASTPVAVQGSTVLGKLWAESGLSGSFSASNALPMRLADCRTDRRLLGSPGM